jgi:serine/threonine-protein kinase
MDRIGDYFVRRLVGEGGMGKVYEAEERLSRRRVALKVLRPELGRSEEARRRFLDEMTILAHLDHPNIVRSLASTEVDGELVMALEFLDGETLRARLSARGRLPWTEAVAIASEVAAALTAAHGQEPPIVHRDLKPENLMLTPSGVKVMDFGIGKVLQAMRKGTTGSVGTLAYMSPEQIDAAPVDHRADLYALGLVLYEMLAGRPPFASESPRQLLEMQCTAPPPPLPDEARAGLPRGVERLLAKLLAKAPAERPASAQEVIAALEPFAAADGAGASASVPTMSSAASSTITAAGSNPSLPTQTSKPTPLPPGIAVGLGDNRAAPPRMDTIALVDRASGPRQISNRRAIGAVVALCLVVGAATYLVRTRWSGGERAATPATEPAAAQR